MALFKQIFTRAGAAPDIQALAATIRPTIGDPFYISPQVTTAGVVSVHIEKPTAWSAGNITTVQAAVSAAPAATMQTEAQNAIDAMPIFEKAILLTLLDQINVLRAALPTPLPAITVAVAIAAVRTKAGTL